MKAGGRRTAGFVSKKDTVGIANLMKANQLRRGFTHSAVDKIDSQRAEIEKGEAFWKRGCRVLNIKGKRTSNKERSIRPKKNKLNN